MSISAHLKAWQGEAFRHLPADARWDVLDFRYAGRGSNNRWNEAGEPTLYLAGDTGVAIAEWARHIEVNRTPELGVAAIERTIYRLRLAVERVLDVRDPQVWSELSLDGAPTCFLDIPLARATARFIRTTTGTQGIFVPSVPFIDQPDRWCLVLFLDKLPSRPSNFISAVSVEGPLRWR